MMGVSDGRCWRNVLKRGPCCAWTASCVEARYQRSMMSPVRQPTGSSQFGTPGSLCAITQRKRPSRIDGRLSAVDAALVVRVIECLPPPVAELNAPVLRIGYGRFDDQCFIVGELKQALSILRERIRAAITVAAAHHELIHWRVLEQSSTRRCSPDFHAVLHHPTREIQTSAPPPRHRQWIGAEG